MQNNCIRLLERTPEAHTTAHIYLAFVGVKGDICHSRCVHAKLMLEQNVHTQLDDGRSATETVIST